MNLMLTTSIDQDKFNKKSYCILFHKPLISE
jgi:hypothetical protein